MNKRTKCRNSVRDDQHVKRDEDDLIQRRNWYWKVKQMYHGKLETVEGEMSNPNAYKMPGLFDWSGFWKMFLFTRT